MHDANPGPPAADHECQPGAAPRALFVAGTFLSRNGQLELWEFRLHTGRTDLPARIDHVEVEGPVTRGQLENAAASLYEPLGYSLVTRISRPGQGLHIARVREGGETTKAPVG